MLLFCCHEYASKRHKTALSALDSPSERPPRSEFGGLDQDRTDDLLNAIEALYQLSYEPVTN
jgi:hypothetical protein